MRSCVILGQRHHLPRHGAKIGRRRHKRAARYEIPQSFEDVLRGLQTTLVPGSQDGRQAMLDFYQIRQRPDEVVGLFSVRFRDAAARASVTDTALLVKTWLEGVLPRYRELLAAFRLGSPSRSFQDFVDATIALEADLHGNAVAAVARCSTSLG